MPQNPNYSAEESAADGRVAALVGVALSVAEDKNQAIVRLRQLAGEWFQLGKANDARALVMELIGWCEANDAPAEVLDNLHGDMSAIEAHKASAGVARDSSDKPPESKPQQKTKSAADTSGQNTSETFMKWLAIPLAVAVVALLWRVSGDSSGPAEVAPPVTITVTQSAPPSKDLPTATAATLDSAPKVAPPKDSPVTESAARKPAPKPAEAAMYVVASGGVNVRATTDATSRVVKKVGQFTDVVGVGKPENRWQKVRVDGRDGYIRADLLAQGDGETARCEAGVERPANGEILALREFGDYVIEIKNSTEDVFAKLKNADGRTILSFYVHGGQRVAINDVASGIHFFQYSTGKRFSVTCEKFMSNARYSRDPEPNKMGHNGNRSVTYTLIPTIRGNLKMQEMSEEEFLQ